MLASPNRFGRQFEIVDGSLHRTFTHVDGDRYYATCEFAVFQAVLSAIEDLAAEGATQRAVAKRIGAPLPQVAVAFEFLQLSGCTTYRKSRAYPPAQGKLFDLGMTVYAALAERKGS